MAEQKMDSKTQKQKNEKLIQEFCSLDLKKATVDDVKVYLEKGVHIDTPDEFDETALVKAIRAKNKNVAEYLISKSANIYATNVCGETTMMVCAKRGYLDFAQLLFENGYNINQMTPLTRQSILGLAIWNHRTKMVSWLVENGANINTVDDTLWTPLMMASYSGFTDIVEILLKHKADPLKRNDKGMTALDLATFYHQDEVIALLKNIKF